MNKRFIIKYHQELSKVEHLKPNQKRKPFQD